MRRRTMSILVAIWVIGVAAVAVPGTAVASCETPPHWIVDDVDAGELPDCVTITPRNDAHPLVELANECSNELEFTFLECTGVSCDETTFNVGVDSAATVFSHDFGLREHAPPNGTTTTVTAGWTLDQTDGIVEMDLRRINENWTCDDSGGIAETACGCHASNSSPAAPASLLLLGLSLLAVRRI